MRGNLQPTEDELVRLWELGNAEPFNLDANDVAKKWGDETVREALEQAEFHKVRAGAFAIDGKSSLK